MVRGRSVARYLVGVMEIRSPASPSVAFRVPTARYDVQHRSGFRRRRVKFRFIASVPTGKSYNPSVEEVETP